MYIFERIIMKKTVCFLLIFAMCLPLVSCFSFPLEQEKEQDTSYKVPIILLHGRASNTSEFFGVKTKIDPDINSLFKADQEEVFTTVSNHEILSITDDKLGNYLVEELGYQPNKNLFAFNYPNWDMVARNAKRLSQYINGLVNSVSNGEEDTADFVDPSYLVDPETKQTKFILIGHSMGGLVSRYYIENINDQYVEKLITICTPHYGSGFATAAELTNFKFLPCDIDLQKNSQLFGGEKKTDDSDDFDALTLTEKEYARLHQSPPLKGNADTNVKYYAIAAYNAEITYDKHGNLDNPYMEKVSPKLLEALAHRNASFSVGLDINTENKSAFQECINKKINLLSLEYYEEPSEFLLKDSDGDNVVNYMSQLAVKFDAEGNTVSHQKIENATLVVASGYDLLKRFHSHIATSSLMHDAVEKYIRANTLKEPSNSNPIRFDKAQWDMMNAQYDEQKDLVILTEDFKTYQCGSIWYNDAITGDFTFEMDYYTGCTDRSYGGADGIVVAFYTNKLSEMVHNGRDIGFSGCEGYGIELDTYYNSERSDPYENNHIALIKGYAGNHIAFKELPESEDEQWHHLKIVVKDGICRAYIDGVLKISNPVEKNEYSHLGITSATGAGHNLHAVKNLQITSNE